MSGYYFNGIKFMLEERIIQQKKLENEFFFLNKGRNNWINFFKRQEWFIFL